MSGAWDKEAGLKKWQRVITHQKGDSIRIADRYEFEAQPGSIVLPLMLVSAPDVSRTGELVFETADGVNLEVRYDREQFEIKVEEIQPEDKKIADRWGGILYRVLLTIKNPAIEGTHDFTIRSLGPE
jgi:hypothetical protein